MAAYPGPSGARLLRELKDRGYEGGYTAVTDFLRDVHPPPNPRALEALDHIVRRLEHGEISAVEAIDVLLSEELTLREKSRIKTALRMGRLATIKTLSGFNFSSSPLWTATASTPSASSASSPAPK